ncbi:MAG: citrate lyase acyl carrier protein [Clostridiaceae bacterium]
MTEIVRKAYAGTLESSDVYVELEPNDKGLDIQMESVVINQFGDAIREAVIEVLEQFEVRNAKVKIVDRGALDCVIRARVEAAIKRGEGK